MRNLLKVLSLILLAGCTTTPNNDDQWAHRDAQAETRKHKAWCARNDGIFVEDDSIGGQSNKCYERKAFNEAIRYDTGGE